MFTSKFRPYSIGIVAENKPMSTKIAKVVPIEVIPFIDGELKSDPQALEVAGVDAAGQQYTVRVMMDNVIDAEWLSLGSNRVTAPDVRRGEQVLIYQYADSDKFYWQPTGKTDWLRKLETVIFAISATRDEADTELRVDNTYSVEMSSHGKHVTLRTSKADGEPFAYTFQFNAKEGVVTLTDDAGNFFELDSGEMRLTLENRRGTKVVLDKDNILFKAVADLVADVGQNATLVVGKDLTLDVKGNVKGSVGGSLTAQVAGAAGVVAKGGVEISNGQATIRMNGPITEIS